MSIERWPVSREITGGSLAVPADLIFGAPYQYCRAGHALTIGAILALLAIGLLPRV